MAYPDVYNEGKTGGDGGAHSLSHLLGRRAANVQAGANGGMEPRVGHEAIVWAKFNAMAEAAALRQ